MSGPEHTLRCTTCSSSETRRVAVVHAEGVSTTTSVSSGIVMTRDGVGVGGGTTTGTSVSALAESLAPPRAATWKRNVILRFFGAVLIGAMIQLASPAVGTLVAWGGMIYSIVLARRERRFNRLDYPRLIEEWNRSFFCTRCGAVFLPSR